MFLEKREAFQTLSSPNPIFLMNFICDAEALAFLFENLNLKACNKEFLWYIIRFDSRFISLRFIQ